MKKNKIKTTKEKGITLIALVVTIVVLLILAGITINYLFSEGGLFDTAKNSGNTWHDAENSDLNALNELNGAIGNLVNGTGSGGTTTPTNPDTPGTDAPTEVPVESVTLSQDAATVYMGESLTLTATVLPVNASNKNVTWKSDNDEIATVDELGVITPVSVGETIITVATADGSKKDTCTITVEAALSQLEQFAKLETFVTDENVDTGKEYKELADKYGNKVRVPKGFKVATDSGSTVPEGIVIEDRTSTSTTTGNQFVWIPVGTVYMNEEKTVTKQVKLGRYTFDSSGAPTPVQLAFNSNGTANYTNENGTVGLIDDTYTELSISREGLLNSSNPKNELNATAKDLGAFLTSANNNGGYYIARFEASYGSGFDISKNTETESNLCSTECYTDAKPLSKKSINSDFDANIVGSLWNNITQLGASKASRNMYVGKLDAKGNSVGVESDLMNSYAWDTAIVYISQMKPEYANFANFNCNTSYGTDQNVGCTMLDNTGTNKGDKFCNIYDMVANCYELTTEYSNILDSVAYTCVAVGDSWIGWYSTASKENYGIECNRAFTFRPICYIK